MLTLSLSPSSVRSQRREPKTLPCRVFCYGPGRNRTCDLGIKSPLLYQLSYRPLPEEVRFGPGEVRFCFAKHADFVGGSLAACVAADAREAGIGGEGLECKGVYSGSSAPVD
jgi:hypothetical protein